MTAVTTIHDMLLLQNILMSGLNDAMPTILSGTIYDYLLSFLLNNDKGYHNELAKLELAPDQLSEEVSPKSLAYFKKVLEDNSQHKPIIFNKLNELYPKVAERLLEESVAKQIDSEVDKSAYNGTVAFLNQSVIGQSKAVAMVATALTRQKWSDENSTFLFIGPTGVGKTSLAQTASLLKKKRFVYFQMSEFSSKTHSTSLFGGGLNWVGSQDRPLFAKEIDRFATKTEEITTANTEEAAGKINRVVSDVVILFDEIEKAHSEVKLSLLGLIASENGTVTITYTKEKTNEVISYIFKRSIFILTSNLYRDEVIKSLQTSDDLQQIQQIITETNNKALAAGKSDSLYSEFLSRCVITPFGPIKKGKDNFHKIIEKELKEFQARRKEFKEIHAKNEANIYAFIETKTYKEGIDIRQVPSYLNGTIYQAILKGMAELGSPSTIKITLSSSDATSLSIEFEKWNEEFQTYKKCPTYTQLLK